MHSSASAPNERFKMYSQLSHYRWNKWHSKWLRDVFLSGYVARKSPRSTEFLWSCAISLPAFGKHFLLHFSSFYFVPLLSLSPSCTLLFFVINGMILTRISPSLLPSPVAPERVRWPRHSWLLLSLCLWTWDFSTYTHIYLKVDVIKLRYMTVYVYLWTMCSMCL